MQNILLKEVKTWLCWSLDLYMLCYIGIYRVYNIYIYIL